MKVAAAVGELETEYRDRVEFTIVPAEETMQRQDEIDAFGFTALKHGLVIFDASGEAEVTMAGHQFGKQEIRAGIETVLAE